MTTKALTINVSPEKGKVSAEYIMPENCIYIMTLAHGAGAGMNHSFMISLANAFAENGIGFCRI
jgi:predicted alpha/beta-hydrolase family hydrolase